MGKNFCKVENKWCKYLKHCGLCAYCNSFADNISKCPRVTEIETTPLHELLRRVNFDVVMSRMTKWFPGQEKNRDGYEKVFNRLRTITPGKKHNLNDLFINVDIVEEDGDKFLDVCGVETFNPKSQKRYGIEFLPWKDWVGMFITQRTLDILPNEEIVAACLYEMTFFGYEEKDVMDEKTKLENVFNECRKSQQK